VGVFRSPAATRSSSEGEIKLLDELAGDLSYALEYMRRKPNCAISPITMASTGLANSELLALRLQQAVDVAAADSFLAVALFDIGKLKRRQPHSPAGIAAIQLFCVR